MGSSGAESADETVAELAHRLLMIVSSPVQVIVLGDDEEEAGCALPQALLSQRLQA